MPWDVVSESPAPVQGGTVPGIVVRPEPEIPKPGIDKGWTPVAAKKANDSVFQPVSDFIAYTKENYKAGLEAQKEPSLTKNVMGVAGMVGAPAGGVAHALISKPLERATGMPAAETDFPLMFTPAGVGGLAGGAMRASKYIPGAEKAWKIISENPVSQNISKAVQIITSPTTLSKEAGQAEGIVREQRGLAERSTEQAKAKLEPDYEYLSTLPPTDQLGFIKRVETFSKGQTLADARAEKAANNIRSIYQTVRNDLQTDSNFDKMGFIEDYYPHMWQDPKAAQAFISGWVSKYGSAKNVQARSIPTIEDGLKAGLKLKNTNPAETTLQYIGNMYNYKMLKGVQSAMTSQGLRKFFPKGSQKPGWVELKGPGNHHLIQTKKGILEQVAYAPEDAARIYNRNYSPGFTGPFGATVRGIRKIANNGTQLVLGLSAYHYRLLVNEGVTAALSRGVTSGLGMAEATPYFGAMAQYRKGAKLETQYLTGKGNFDQKIIDYVTRGGGRMKGVDRSMDMSAQGDYWRAWKNGSLKASMKADALNLKAGGPIKVIMKTVGSVSQPLFMKTIPRIKNAVNYEAISDWIKVHPTATDDEILKASRDIVDSTDNRFGEMIQDNIFWDKRLKESSQLMLLSTGWALGTRRETIGGAKDLANFIAGKGELTQRARYVLTAPLAHALNSAVYQYLKTGATPQDLQDLVYPRTGGTSPYGGMPERSALPGQENLIIRMQKEGIEKSLSNEMLPLWKTIYQMRTNQNWRDDPIAYQYYQNAPGWLRGYAEELVDAFAPISVKGALEKPLKGSNIGSVGRFLGDRPASMGAENPAAYKKMQKDITKKKEKTGIRHLKLDESRRQQ